MRALAIAAAMALVACGSSTQQPREAGSDDAGHDAGDAPVADGGAPEARDDGAADAPDDGSAADAQDDGGSADAQDGGSPPELLFVATYLGGLSTFTVDGSSGRLDPAHAPYDVGAQLYALAVHPSGRFAYATDLRGTLIGYAVTRGTGTLAHLWDAPITIGTAAIAAAIDPAGRFLYVGDEQSFHVFAIDPTTGALDEIQRSPFDIGGRPSTIAFHPSGRFLFSSFGSIGPESHGGIRIFGIDPTSGAPAEVASSPFITDNVRGGGTVVHPSGKFLYVGSFKLYGFRIDQDTGALDALSGFPLGGGNSDSTAIDVALDPEGKHLYATDFVGKLYGYRIDAATGMLLDDVPNSPFDAGTLPYSLAIDPTGRFVYVGNDDVNQLSIFSRDPATGALAPAGAPITVNGLQPEIVVTNAGF
jgi:6-phosphogluconolactonase (cycloisomerase 2 family)